MVDVEMLQSRVEDLEGVVDRMVEYGIIPKNLICKVLGKYDGTCSSGQCRDCGEEQGHEPR